MWLAAATAMDTAVMKGKYNKSLHVQIENFHILWDTSINLNRKYGCTGTKIVSNLILQKMLRLLLDAWISCIIASI